VLTRRTGLSRRLLTVCAAAALMLSIGLTGSAAARDPGATCPPTQTNCDVWDGNPGTPGNPGTGNPGGGGGNDGPARKCSRDGVPLPCYDDILGWFSSSDGCYYKLAEPQPADVPEGQDMYLRSCAGTGVGSQVAVLLNAPPAGFGAPPDPAELAAEALASITLRGVVVGVAPDPAKGAGLVGLPIWLWGDPPADNPSLKETWGPNRASASDRGVTVTIDARVEKVVWTMGNRARIACSASDAQVKYDPLIHKNSTPACGYAGYPKPSGSDGYTVSAVSHWRVTWTSTSGESGVINTTRSSNTETIHIDELQVVTK
jgi:hypothetical protein